LKNEPNGGQTGKQQKRKIAAIAAAQASKPVSDRIEGTAQCAHVEQPTHKQDRVIRPGKDEGLGRAHGFFLAPGNVLRPPEGKRVRPPFRANAKNGMQFDNGFPRREAVCVVGGAPGVCNAPPPPVFHPVSIGQQEKYLPVVARATGCAPSNPVRALRECPTPPEPDTLGTRKKPQAAESRPPPDALVVK